MNPNVLLNAWKPDFLDPMELYSKGMNMRALVDARKAQQIQRQFAIEDQERKRSLLQLLQSNPNATREEILQVDPFGGMALIKEQDAQRKEQRLAQEAQARAEKTEQDILQAKRVWQGKLAVSMLGEKDPTKQEELFKRYTPGMVAVDMLSPEEAAEPFNPSLLWRIAERGLPTGAQDLRDKIAKAQREEEEETRKRLKFGPDFAKSKFDAEKAQRELTGQEPTTEEKTFRNVFLPGYLKTNRLPPTDENVYQAYSEFQEAKRPRIGGVPGVDVPKPQAVIDQDVEKAARIAAINAANASQKPATEGERKTLGFYERMKNAEENLSTLEDTLSKLDTMGQLRLKNAPDWAQSKEGQLYHQALRQFTEARLRKESGAVIGPSEFELSEKTFFRQPNDDPETVKRKKAARAQLLNSMRREAGKAYTQTYGEGEPTTPTTAPADVVQWERGPDGKARRKQ